MEKLSKSKTPKWTVNDGDGATLEVEPDGDGDFLVSTKHLDDDTWRVVTVRFDMLEEMLDFARRNREKHDG